MEKKKNVVVVVRLRPLPRWMTNHPIDLTDYTNERITAIVPCRVAPDETIHDLRTGTLVTLGPDDEVRTAFVGTAFDYPDGEKLILTRGWKDGRFGEFIAERTCRDSECVVIKAFGA